MSDFSLFSDKITALNIRASSSEEVITILGEMLRTEGYVKDTFVENAIDREKEFSTGLPLGTINVALPHTDAVHVNQQAVAVGVLQSPVEFHVMGSPDQTIPVQIVFLMAINNPDNQVTFLQTFAELLQNPEVTERIRYAQNVDEIIHLLQPQFQ